MQNNDYLGKLSMRTLMPVTGACQKNIPTWFPTLPEAERKKPRGTQGWCLDAYFDW